MTFQITGSQFLLPNSLSSPSVLSPLQTDADYGSTATSTLPATTTTAPSTTGQSNSIQQMLGVLGQTLSLLLSPSSGGTTAAPASTSTGVANPTELADAAIQRNTTADPTQRQRLNNNLTAIAQDPEGSKLLQTAIANGYTIEVGDPVAAAAGSQDAADPDTVNGVTLPDQKKIVINPNAPDFTKTVAHELVHAATDADGDSKDEEGKADVIGYRIAERLTGQAPPVPGLSTPLEEQVIYNSKVDNPAYASLGANNGVDQTLAALGIQAFSA
jgi:hypothetical protein